MTEFALPSGAVLGLMPEAGIARLLEGSLGPMGRGARRELYLVVDDASSWFARAVEAGAQALSPVSPRDWGHRAGYRTDPNGQVLAVAEVAS